MQLSVIIVNYNVKFFLEQCLSSLHLALLNIEAEVFVVDNFSSDDSVAYLQPKFPWVNFIQNKANTGFAKANNQALQFASGEFILFLNPDTILPEDALANCFSFFHMHPGAGATGVRMIDGSGGFLPESKRSFPSPLVSFYKLTGLSTFFPSSRKFNQYALGYLDEHQVYEVDVLAGAFMMVKREVLTITGSFDERFFMYGEDIDLSYRIQKAGFKNYYLGTITIVHFKGESTKRGSLNYVRIFYNAMLLFVQKHYYGAGAWVMSGALQGAIIFRAFCSATAIPLVRLLSSIRRKKPNRSTIYLAGCKVDTQAAEPIVRCNQKGSLAKTIVTVTIDEAEQVKEGEMVLCSGGAAYASLINLLQQIPPAVYVKWFGKNTLSIVGSNDKNKTGEVYTAAEC